MTTAFRYWMMRYRRTWHGSIVISVANPLLFLLAMGAGLGHLIDQHSGTDGLGGSYAAFFAPGMLAAAAMQTGYLEASWPVQNAAGRDGAYRSAIPTPMGTQQILGGHLIYIAFRIVSSNAAYVLVMGAFGMWRGWWTAGLLLASVLVGLAFAAPAAAWAVGVQRNESIQSVFRFVIMPMYMFSGTFFATSVLPGWLRWIVQLTPLWHGTALCRSLANGTATLWPAIGHASILLALAAGGVIVARVTYARTLHP